MALDSTTAAEGGCAPGSSVIVAALLHPNVAPAVVGPFCNAGCTIGVRETLDDTTRLDAVLIFGGDGTIHRYLPELSRRRLPFLIVPKGSGNDFAKALGIANEAVALRAWSQFCATGENVKQIDLGIIQKDRQAIPFCCVVGAGLDSAANAKANRMPRWIRGSAGYLAAALRVLPSFQPAEFTLTAGPRVIERSGFFVAVGNAHRYGGGMRVVPKAELDDGLLDVCFVGDMSKLKLLLAVPTVFFGAHLGIKQVDYFQAAAVKVGSDRPLDVYADGEFACQTPVEISLLPKALSVIVPGERC